MTVARIRALTRPTERLKAIADGLLGEVVVLMDKQLDEAVDTLRTTKPPPIAGSKYIRTGTYNKSWHQGPAGVHLTQEGLIGTIESDAVDPGGRHYTEIVGGDEAGRGQAQIHFRRWILAAETLRGFSGEPTFRSKLLKVLRGL